MLETEGVEFTISVPFERFTELKERMQSRKRWYHLSGQWDCFQTDWKPKKWNARHRFLLIRQQSRQQYKGPVQLDLFIPYEYGYKFKVIVTNKQLSAKKVLAFHNGRGPKKASLPK